MRPNLRINDVGDLTTAKSLSYTWTSIDTYTEHTVETPLMNVEQPYEVAHMLQKLADEIYRVETKTRGKGVA